jgi:nucleoid-associated protein YgaU
MGLFDFIKTAGEDELTETVTVSPERLDQLRQQEITKSLARLDVEGEQVTVSVTGDIATLTGTAPSQAALEKIVLCAGNQYGISQVDCQLTVDAPPAAAAASGSASPAAESDTGTPVAASAAADSATTEQPSTFYTVESGDTLGKIAAQHYGDASKYPLIFEANRPMLTDPDKIYPGQTLRIPPL